MHAYRLIAVVLASVLVVGVNSQKYYGFAFGYINKNAADVPGNDIPCSGSKFCKACGTVQQVSGACNKTRSCVAFTYDGTCGYLKRTADGAVAKPVWSLYAQTTYWDSVSGPSTGEFANPTNVYNRHDGVDIKGLDIPCNRTNFCKVCGPLAQVRAACQVPKEQAKPSRLVDCVAFTYDGSCGYLKAGADAALKKAGWATYVNAAYYANTAGGPTTGVLANPDVIRNKMLQIYRGPPP